MTLADLVQPPSEQIFSDEDRMNHLKVYAERQFGVSIDQLGAIEMRDGKPVLIFAHDGADHTLTWTRQPGGAVMWHLDGSDKPLALGEQSKAVERLLAALR